MKTLAICKSINSFASTVGNATSKFDQSAKEASARLKSIVLNNPDGLAEFNEAIGEIMQHSVDACYGLVSGVLASETIDKKGDIIQTPHYQFRPFMRYKKTAELACADYGYKISINVAKPTDGDTAHPVTIGYSTLVVVEDKKVANEPEPADDSDDTDDDTDGDTGNISARICLPDQFIDVMEKSFVRLQVIAQDQFGLAEFESELAIADLLRVYASNKWLATSQPIDNGVLTRAKNAPDLSHITGLGNLESLTPVIESK